MLSAKQSQNKSVFVKQDMPSPKLLCYCHCDLDLYPTDPKIDREHTLYDKCLYEVWKGRA